MYELRIRREFAAAHHLKGYLGDCARVHGHNWELEAFFQAEALDELGMAVDFRTLKRATEDLMERWDHQDLNQLAEFEDQNPTAENLARVAFQKLAARVNDNHVRVSSVTIWENSRCAASYFEAADS